ncbi:uncharacterized protein F4822DRAFT_420607 [Hypoxylon trugodes]|uniref:uncharacterized protein n=1 Tax=Hypoxylon trugodes TaxID=326681 RepID=UPI0021A11559|nr:uncharacterized protein F4822DRAFT_420607 [Hypoxylon trugodes]KAI1383429.1 hypothetical protein F4822DRAFT_420607 [Hypoxylon trugodes]
MEMDKQGFDQASSYKEKLKHVQGLIPIDKPLITWDGRRGRSPREYLKPPTIPYGQKVAEWQNALSGQQDVPGFRDCSEVRSLRKDAPTMVLIFYPRPDEDNARPIHQSPSYLKRIERIAQMGEQTIIYVPPELTETIRAMRSDPHWHIVDAYPTIWDVPTNNYQRDNFTNKQPKLFRELDGYSDADGELRPIERYNRGHHSAVCNAKAFIMYDAIMRNPFGSDRWMYVDAGFLFDDGPKDADGVIWGDLIKSGLDSAKFDRAISVSRDTGVVMGEYCHRDSCPDINDECWSNPKRTWRTRQFIKNVYVGNSLGMLNYSVRFMQTVDDMDANGFYTGREEYVVAFVVLRYPNSVFSIPWFPLPRQLDYRWQFPGKLVFSRIGGPESVPPIVDPIAALYVRDYVPSRPSLDAGGIYTTTPEDHYEWEIRHGVIKPT